MAHEFEKIGPMYYEVENSASSTHESHNDDGDGVEKVSQKALGVQDTKDDEDGGDGTASPRSGSVSSEDFGFDME